MKKVLIKKRQYEDIEKMGYDVDEFVKEAIRRALSVLKYSDTHEKRL